MNFKVKLALFGSKKKIKKISESFFHEVYFKTKNGQKFGFMYFRGQVSETLIKEQDYYVFTSISTIQSPKDIWYFIDENKEVGTTITFDEFEKLLEDAELINIVGVIKGRIEEYDILDFEFNNKKVKASNDMILSLM